MFSVVIPLFNKEKSIVRCINSVLSQSFQNFEIIVVNDGSTDSSLSVVNQITDKRILVIDQLNGGVSCARNVGIVNASNKYIAFLDADDYWSSDYLLEMMNFIESKPNAAMWGCAYTNVSSYLMKDQKVQDFIFCDYVNDYFKYALSKGHLFHTSAVIVKKSILSDSNIQFDLDLKRGEDLDFYFQIALRYQVAYLSKKLTFYNLLSENRVMKSSVDLSNRLIGKINKYDRFRCADRSLDEFISKYIVRCLPDIAFNYGDTSVNILKQKVSYDILDFKSRILFHLPGCVLKYVYILIFKKLAG